MDRQSHYSLAACLVCWLANLLLCQACAGQDAVGAADESPLKTIVLSDGGVLVGSVSRSGDRYVITRAGSEFQVAAARVQAVCDSLEEAYGIRREKIGKRDAASHLQLAEWCLRYYLVLQATRELKDARELDPLNPRLALLERRLAAVSNARRQPAVLTRPRDESVATFTPANAPPNATAHIKDLPDGALELFTRKVQPILVNNCTLSGCHQPGGAQKFQLDRSLLHGLGNRRTTMHNLSAVLALIDRAQPHLSPLLTVPRQTHGGMEGPIFGPRHAAAFTHLVDWVAMISDMQPDADEGLSTDDAAKQAVHEEIEIPPAAQPNSTLGSIAVSDVSTESPARSRSPLRYGAELKTWQPKDPFDPEIFNRAMNRQAEAGEAIEGSPGSNLDSTN
jgi:hypothetical protein